MRVYVYIFGDIFNCFVSFNKIGDGHILSPSQNFHMVTFPTTTHSIHTRRRTYKKTTCSSCVAVLECSQQKSEAEEINECGGYKGGALSR